MFPHVFTFARPRGGARSVKRCIYCSATYAEVLGTKAECNRPRPPAAAEPEADETKANQTLVARVKGFMKAPSLPARRGCKGLYCATTAEHTHTGTRIIYFD